MSNQERKLAAIVYTDIAGFSALSAADESRALELVNLQREIVEPIVENYNGNLHKEIGDGFLLTFPTVTAAVEFGIDFQRAVKKVGGLNIRIGIHEGEITEQNNDVFGDDVNIGARIEPHSPIGGIAISEKVKLEIGSLPEYQTQFIGEPKLKGISQPIKIYCISSHGLVSPFNKDEPSVTAQHKPKFQFNILNISGIILTVLGGTFWLWYSFGSLSQGAYLDKKTFKSIAVLYLENLSDDREDANISAALTMGINTAISRLGFEVKARTDVNQFKNKIYSYTDIKTILGVDAYIDGSIIKLPGSNEYIADIQLVDAEKGNNIWAGQFKKGADEVLNIPKLLVSELTQFLGVHKTDSLIITKNVQPIGNQNSFSLMGRE